MADLRSRTTINLSSLGDRIENLRSDNAWKALTLAKKVVLLLGEYLEILEKNPTLTTQSQDSAKPKDGESTTFLRFLATGKRPTDAQIIETAHETGIAEEELIELRDLLFPNHDRMTNGI